MRVSDLMRTPAVVCRPTATLRDVAQLMDVRNVGSVCVIDNIGYLAGIVTDRDIAVRGTGAGRSPDVSVTEVMTRDVATVLPSSDVVEAAAIMQKRGVRRVPIVDHMGHVHGVVTLDDLMRNLSHEADTLNDTLTAQTYAV